VRNINSSDFLGLLTKPDVEWLCRYGEFAGQPGEIFSFVVDKELVTMR